MVVDEGISRVDPPREQGFLRSKHTWREALAAGDFAEIVLLVALSAHQSKLHGELFCAWVTRRVVRCSGCFGKVECCFEVTCWLYFWVCFSHFKVVLLQS